MNTYDDLRTAIDLLGGQTAVSRRFEIPYRTVQNWYAGIRNPPPYVMHMIFEIENSENETQEIIFELERKLEAEERKNEVLQGIYNAAVEVSDMRKRENERLENKIALLKEEVERQKEARMAWARAAGQKHL